MTKPTDTRRQGSQKRGLETSPDKSASLGGPRKGDFTETDLPDKIGRSLRQMWDDVVNEPVPEDFLNLLKNADKADKDGTQ